MAPDHQEILDKVAEELFHYVHETWVIKSLLKRFDEKVSISSPYLNFRDALFHFNKMYDAANNNNDNGLIQQQACINEHLNRGIKDFAVFICANFYAKILHLMIASNARTISVSNLKKLRHIYHDLKNIVIDIRIGGQNLERFDNLQNTWLPKITAAIGAFHSLLDETQALNQLFDAIALVVSTQIMEKIAI